MPGQQDVCAFVETHKFHKSDGVFGLLRVSGLNSCACLRGRSGSTQTNTAALVQGTFKLID